MKRLVAILNSGSGYYDDQQHAERILEKMEKIFEEEYKTFLITIEEVEEIED